MGHFWMDSGWRERADDFRAGMFCFTLGVRADLLEADGFVGDDRELPLDMSKIKSDDFGHADCGFNKALRLPVEDSPACDF